MKELIEKLERREELNEKEIKFIKMSMNHVDLNVDDVYQSILDAEHALSTMLPKDLMLQIATTRLNYGMWRGLEGYDKLEKFLNMQMMPKEFLDSFNIYKMDPGQVLNRVERTLMDKLGIAIYDNRNEFNEFVRTSSKEFIDIYMEETKVICIIHPEDDSSYEERMAKDLAKKFGGISGVTVGSPMELKQTWLGKFASYLIRLDGATAVEKTHNKFANHVSTAISLARHARKLKNETVQEEDVTELKKHILEKYHEKFLLGHDSLVTYLKSL